MRRPPLLRFRQRGAAVVEFALVGLLFFTLLFGVMEMGRVLFTWNAAVEATRYGARVAAVCNIGSSSVLKRMQLIMPSLTSGNVNVAYLNQNMQSGCNKTNCVFVRVSIVNLQLTTNIPVVGAMLNVPPFATTLPRESLESVNSASESNPVCI